jgi:hypothetical protein
MILFHEDGTRVKGYDRTSKDSIKTDNWSAKGNINLTLLPNGGRNNSVVDSINTK